MSDFISHSATIQSDFDANSSWVILSPIEATIKRKIEAKGTPLKDWNIQIYRGVLTGYNDAFIIDQQTRDMLIKASSKNAEIIRPIISGKEIKRYQINWQNSWIINSHNGVKARGIPRVNIVENYPGIYEYLKTYSPKIEKRSDQGDHWTNLRNCAYLEAFEKPKIVWGNLALRGQFALVNEPMIVNNPSNFMLTDSLYLLGILNSLVIDFYIKQLGVMRNGGYFEYKPMFIEQVPIPLIPAEREISISEKVKILTSAGDNKVLIDREIEELVCDLFELNPEEKEFIYKFADSINLTSSKDNSKSEYIS